MAIINAVMTDTGLNLIAQHLAGTVSDFSFSYFKIGEGGFNESGGIKTAKTPDATYTSIESDGTVLSGSLTFSNGSSSVSGSSTAFSTEITPGQYIRLDADLVWYEVATITDDNNLTLTSTYNETGGSGPGSVITTNYAVYKNTFSGTDITYEGDGKVSAVAFLDFSDGNSNGYEGGDPEYFEIGVYDANDNLLAYGTYPGETKNNTIQLNKVVRMTFARV